MVTMYIHNKYEVSLSELVKQTEKRGGTPKHIDVEPMEAWGILNEMRAAGSTASTFKLMFTGPKELKPYQAVFLGEGNIDRPDANVLIQQWWNKDWWVEYQGIPLYVVAKKKQPDGDIETPKPETVEPVNVGGWPGFTGLFGKIFKRKES